MANPNPVVGNWYKDVENERIFQISSMNNKLITILYTDGESEDLGLDGWDDLALDQGFPPENWPGPYDLDVEQLGYWDISTHPEGAPRPLTEVEGAEPDRGPQKSP